MSQNDRKATAHAVFLVMGYNALLNSAVVSSWSKRRDFLICSYFSALSQSSNKFKLNVDYGSMNQNMFLVKSEMWVCYTEISLCRHISWGCLFPGYWWPKSQSHFKHSGYNRIFRISLLVNIYFYYSVKAELFHYSNRGPVCFELYNIQPRRWKISR